MKKAMILSATTLLLLSGCQQVEEWTDNLMGEKEQAEEPVKPKQESKEQVEEKEKPITKEPEETVPPELQLQEQYFNDVQVVDGKKMIQNPQNVLALVNKEFALGEYKPNDLVRPNVPFVFGEKDLEKAHLRNEAAKALENMFNEAKKQNIYLTAVSGYRSYDYQKMLLEREIAQFGKEKAVLAVAPPGQSEHQSGLAMDISSQSNDFKIDEAFGKTKEGIWLKENAHLFGYILRYPQGKEDITHYQYEPWHFRYVGKDAAKVIFENDWTLEEYFQNVKKI
ncbi:D-alanyl-D-alanine carboxypeptidase [Bacillus pakistanensis]|uniref:D-alanyl-D-alanine carboxypeptidase n=1 Tax=Rossellomorea pakistanensis TaxID=992288 RepID=A0ABS2N8W0_9BACI|nr:M15 family metallopeptidase [Bacillus pakistanensis]MBM7584220.1 D-alanyl-D-alanine carboxypeptidase [Bacillus pakistanensis]